MLFILVFIFILSYSLMFKYSQEKKIDYAFGCIMCMIIFVYLIFYS